MSHLRSASPTTAQWLASQESKQQMAKMVHMGLHVFNPEWQSNKGGVGRMYSTSFRQITLKIFGGDERITFPVQTCTKVQDLREALARCLMINQDGMEFLVRQGCNTRRQLPAEEIGSTVTVRGIPSFKATPHKWEHPTAIIGAGYGGLKCLMTYVKAGCKDVVAFEKLSVIGGYNWLHAANKTSKLQTELGSFHVWWGEEFVQENNGYPDVKRWGIWPSKALVVEHMQYAAEAYGVLPHVRFNNSVEQVDVLGGKKDLFRQYSLSVKGNESEDMQNYFASVIFSFPGIMQKNRIITYPGEDVFGGEIGYGMNDECPYDSLKGSRVAVLGNGAFAVENTRTCVEYGCTKVYIITRRKSLACPRLPCWFSHQGPAPTPGWLILKMFEPMYELAGMGDPWDYYAVHAPKDRSSATIIQGSRFGIGDVTFLMHAYGKLAYVQDTLKRLTRHTLHLSSGEKLEDINVILKALGLLGSYKFDEIMRMKQVVGQWCDGDFRRPFNCDATGMNAANFTTFSGGIGYKDFAAQFKHIVDFPKLYHRAADQGLMEQLPVHKPKLDEEKPAYAININHAMTAGIILGGLIPEIVPLSSANEAYKHRMYHAIHGTRYFLDTCKSEWDRYQKQWQADGSTQEYIPYPYTMEHIHEYFRIYCETTGVYISPEGPPQDMPAPAIPNASTVPGEKPVWAENEGLIAGVQMQVNYDHKAWWAMSTSATQYDGFLRKERRNPMQPDYPLAAPGWWDPPEQRGLGAP